MKKGLDKKNEKYSPCGVAGLKKLFDICVIIRHK